MEKFLNEDYEVPSSSGGYMKFEKGENQFRFLAKPIMGLVYWKDDGEGGRTPIRAKNEDEIDPFDVPNKTVPKHFWAAPVWNYDQEQVVVLEITQKGILRELVALIRNDKWGSPKNYDIVVTRTGDGMKTKYSVTPNPKEDLPKEAQEAWANTEIDLEQLFKGESPFTATDKEADDILDDVEL